jgi:hypothetical protein
VCTIHQPSDDMLGIFDYLVLMAQGSLVYVGPVDCLMKYMKSIGYSPPAQAVEYCLELLGQSQTTASSLIACWQNKGQQHEEPRSPHLLASSKSTADGVAKSSIVNDQDSRHIINNLGRTRPGFLRQVLILTLRHGLYSVMSVHGFLSVILRSIITGVIYGLLYYQNMDKLYDEGQFFWLTPTLELSKYAYNLLGLGFSFIITTILINGVSVPAFYELSRFYDAEKVFYILSRLILKFNLCFVNLLFVSIYRTVACIILALDLWRSSLWMCLNKSSGRVYSQQ